MDRLILTMSKLMEVCQEAHTPLLTLPQIAVVGGQSAGKSSVLEAFVGKSFLPSGEGIVTRRPLKLTLINDPTDTSPDGVATFSERPGQSFTDFEEVKAIIEEETMKIAGARKISDIPINLTIKSKSVSNLILVDLPGRVIVAGDGQDSNTPQQIDQLIAKFIDNPKTIILVVTEATRDVETSLGHQYANKFDPTGERTVCVVTKMDRANDKQRIIQTLLGKIHSLKLGYFGVRLRGPKEVQDGMTVMQCRELEPQFFKSEFPQIANQCGMDAVSSYLSNLLIQKIQAELPSLDAQLSKQSMQIEEELHALGTDLDIQTDLQRNTLFTQCIHQFKENYQNLIDKFDSTQYSLQATKKSSSSSSGSSSSSSSAPMSALAVSLYEGQKKQTKPAPLQGGARINKLLREDLREQVRAAKVNFEMDSDRLLTFMRNTEGLSSSLYVPEKCFHQLVRQQIDKFKAIVTAVVEECHRICGELVRQALNQISILHRFPQLRIKLQQTTQALLGQWRANTMDECLAYLQAEKSYINTKNPNFKPANCLMMVQREKAQRAGTLQQQQTQPQQPTQAKPKQQQFAFGLQQQRPQSQPVPTPAPQPAPDVSTQLDLTDADKEKLIYLLVVDYFAIVKRNIIDVIPKTIVYLLVDWSKSNFHDAILHSFSPQDVDECLVEDPAVQAKRQALNQRKQNVQKARLVLDDVRS